MTHFRSNKVCRVQIWGLFLVFVLISLADHLHECAVSLVCPVIPPNIFQIPGVSPELAARYGMVWYGVVWYGMVWYGMLWYGMLWYAMVGRKLNSKGDRDDSLSTSSAFSPSAQIS